MMKPKDTGDDPAARLEQLIRNGKGLLPFFENVPDKEFPKVNCSVYGATETNELFVKLANGTVTFVEAIPSGLVCPAMADRIFGMDAADEHEAFALAEKMWERHKTDLLK